MSRAQTIDLCIERDEALCGEGPSPWSYEYEVEVEMDEGSVHSAVITSRWSTGLDVVDVPRQPIELTRRERERAEEDWREELVARAEDAAVSKAEARAGR